MNMFRTRVADILLSRFERTEKARALAILIRAERKYHGVGLYDVTTATITAIAWTGRQGPAFPTFARNEGLNGAAVTSRRPVLVQDVSKDARYLTTFGATRAECIFPVFSEDGERVVGTIDVESDRVDAFEPSDDLFLRECATLLQPLWSEAPITGRGPKVPAVRPPLPRHPQT